MKKKRQLVGGILLMILGLGICGGSMALRYFERGGYGPYNIGHKMFNHYGMNGGFNQNPNRKIPNFKNQAPNPNGNTTP